MSHRALTGSVIVLLTLAANGCAKDAAPVEVTGACGDAFAGKICTWAKTSGTALVEAGAMVPLASIESAPAQMPMAWPPEALLTLDMPESARQQGGLTHMTWFWEAEGHPPGAYLTPHFDFHFYLIPPADVAAIDCADLSKPAVLPAAFGLPDVELPPMMAQMTGVPTLVGLCVPKMGMHSVLASEIVRTEPFDGTMVIGYYKQKPIFIEPMISKAMLMKKASFDLPMPEIPGLTGPHPTKFHAEYDAAAQAYRFTFSGFVPAS
jgi:hypothetical protein